MASEAEDSYNVTIQALSIKTRRIISTLLNPKKIITTEKGLPRDWQGLAELTGVSRQHLPSLCDNTDQTQRILQIWHDLDKEESTIKQLLRFLGKLDRFDIIDDIQESIVEDIKVFKGRFANDQLERSIQHVPDADIITIDDSLEAPQIYDAFVLYAVEDIEFATKLINIMEKQYFLKLCVKDRDIHGGIIEMDAVVKLISERCNKLILILSEAFIKSRWNTFYASIAQKIGIDQRTRKVIPCVYKQCNVPSEIGLLFPLDYRTSSPFWDFWYKLYSSIVTAEQLQKYKDKKSSKEEQEAVCEKKEKEKEKEKEPPAKPKKECVKFSTNPAEGANSTNSPLTNSAKPKGNWNFVRKFRRAIMPSKTRNKRKAALAC